MITDAIKFVQTNKEKLSMPTKEENKGSKESKDCGVILSRQKNSKSKHLEGQKSLDENTFAHFYIATFRVIIHHFHSIDSR
jgi:hypothetical protein